MPMTRARLASPRLLTALAIALLSASACSDPTGLPEPLVVTLQTSMTYGPVLHGDEDPPEIGCGVRVIAQAAGPGRADWQGAVLRFYAGADRSEALDTVYLSEEDMLGAWSLDSISRTRSDTSDWNFTAAVPFEVEFAFEYQPRGADGVKVASARFSCGPTPSASSAPPTLSLVEVRTSDPELNLGDTVFVTYDASGPAGLWRSGVALSGPIEAEQWRPDTLLTSARHTVAFVMRAPARLDVPVSVLLLADDIALRRSTSLHTTAVRVIDRVAPGVGAYAPGGRLATGALVGFTINASDDNGVRAIVWEIDGEVSARDSIVLSSPQREVSRNVTVPVQPTWAGKSGRLRVRVYDDGGLASAEWVSNPGIYRFHSGFAAPAASYAFEQARLPDAHAYDPVHRRFFGSYATGGVVGVIIDAMVPLPPINVATPGVLAVTPSGDTLVVAGRTGRTIRLMSAALGGSYGTITLTAVDSIVAPGTQPAIAPDWMAATVGGKLFVHLASLPGVIEVDLVGGTQRYRLDFSAGGAAPFGFGAPDAHRVLLTNGSCYRWYSVDTDSFSACQPSLGVDPRFFSFPLVGDGIGAGPRVLDGTLSPLGPGDPQGMSIPAPDGVHHWNADMWDGRIYKVRSSDGAVIASTPLPGQAWMLRLLPDGKTLVVLGYDAIYRIDLSAAP